MDCLLLIDINIISIIFCYFMLVYKLDLDLIQIEFNSKYYPYQRSYIN